MSKIKRPEKMHLSAGANGVVSSVSTSPSIPTKKPPPILPPTSAMSNAAINGVSRTSARPRRDGPPQAVARGQRTASAGLRSASMIQDMQAVQTSQPPPYSMESYYTHTTNPLTMISSIRQLYPKKISLLSCVAHRPSPPDSLPI